MCVEYFPTIFPRRLRVVASFFVRRAPTDDGSEVKPDLMLLNSWIEKGLKVITGGLDRNYPSASGFSPLLGLLIMQDKGFMLNYKLLREVIGSFFLTFISFTRKFSKPCILSFSLCKLLFHFFKIFIKIWLTHNISFRCTPW